MTPSAIIWIASVLGATFGVVIALAGLALLVLGLIAVTERARARGFQIMTTALALIALGLWLMGLLHI